MLFCFCDYCSDAAANGMSNVRVSDQLMRIKFNTFDFNHTIIESSGKLA